MSDARRYYTNIVGKYGPQVQMALKKAAALDIALIAPLHGIVWRSKMTEILEKYQLWSTYTPEETGVLVLYGSMYGNTENAANVLAAMLADRGIHKIAVYDVSNTHVSQLIAESFRYSHIVLAAPTYNNEIYPAMYNYLHDLKSAQSAEAFVRSDRKRYLGTAQRQSDAGIPAGHQRHDDPGTKRDHPLCAEEESRAQLAVLADAIAASLHS
ncbi:MAG: flavodoxin domain-containing protein [Merdibacter sp.]